MFYFAVLGLYIGALYCIYKIYKSTYEFASLKFYHYSRYPVLIDDFVSLSRRFYTLKKEYVLCVILFYSLTLAFLLSLICYSIVPIMGFNAFMLCFLVLRAFLVWK